MKPHLSRLLIACLLSAPCSHPFAQETIPHVAIAAYERHAALKTCAPDEAIDLDLPLSTDTKIDYDAVTGRLRVFYPTQFNDLTEGWNWHPEEVAAGRDYYTYKFLPLGSAHEARGSYRNTDPAGMTVEYPIRWRWDYFFAFDNPYDFYPHDAGEAAGYAAEFAVTAADANRLRQGDLRMGLRGRLRSNCLSESTTFWKATASAPVDFTLKKRYLIGRLDEIRFSDAASGQLLARVPAGSKP
ncbi:MAG: hypothetical protein AB1443_08335 [Pseudomonadota bacterium]